jgi:hypothetical protein
VPLLLAALLATAARGQDEEEDSSEVECAPGSDGLFPHPEYCDRYFECREGQLVRRKQCEDGLVFDPEKTSNEDPCDHVHNVKDGCEARCGILSLIRFGQSFRTFFINPRKNGYNFIQEIYDNNVSNNVGNIV